MSVDVRDKEAVKEAMKTVYEAYGKLDILVANAAIMGKLEARASSSYPRVAGVC